MDNVYLRLGELKLLPKEVLQNPQMIRMLRRVNANPDKLDMQSLTSMLDMVSAKNNPAEFNKFREAVDQMDAKTKKSFLQIINDTHKHQEMSTPNRRQN